MEEFNRTGLTVRRNISSSLQINRTQGRHYNDGILIGRPTFIQRRTKRQGNYLLGPTSKNIPNNNAQNHLSHLEGKKRNIRSASISSVDFCVISGTRKAGVLCESWIQLQSEDLDRFVDVRQVAGEWRHRW